MSFIHETRQDGSVASDQTSTQPFFFLLDLNLFRSRRFVGAHTFLCVFFLRDKPNLFYFDMIKCAASVNIMATALNGFQCPTTQVRAVTPTLLCSINNSQYLNLSHYGVVFFLGVCANVPQCLLGCGTLRPFKKTIRSFQPRPVCAVLKPESDWAGGSHSDTVHLLFNCV